MTESTTRGIVICPQFVHAGKDFNLNCDVEPAALRRYLLYWDKIAYAYPNGLGHPNFQALHDLGFLAQIGVLSLHDIPVSTADIGMPEVPSPLQPSEAPYWISGGPRTTENPSGNMILGCPVSVWPQLSTFAQLRAATAVVPRDGGLWSVGEFNEQLSTTVFPNALEHTLEAALHASLPVPAGPTPLDDIMKFRLKRKEELLQFRSAIDRLHAEVMSQPDSERGVLKAKEEIELAVIQIHRTLHEAGIRSFFSTLKLYLGVRDSAVVTTLLGVLGATGAGLPLEVGAAAGLSANAVLTFAERHFEASRGLPSELYDFAYLYDIQRCWPSAGAS